MPSLLPWHFLRVPWAPLLVFGMLGTMSLPCLHSWSYDRNKTYGQVFKIEDTRILKFQTEVVPWIFK